MIANGEVDIPPRIGPASITIRTSTIRRISGGPDYYRSSENLYYRYPPEMQIPVYNRGWHNEYPQPRRYYQGHDFIFDVF